MSKKLAAQALDALLSTQNSSLSKSTEPTKAPKKKRSKKDQLPKTKTGLKKIKHELRYGHSVKRNQEAQESRENPLEKLQSQIEKEEAIVEKNLNYYKVTQRVSKKELELRKKIKMLREKAKGEQSRKAGVEQDESDGEDF
ncbi:hypothetical protein BG006_003873 [Podila minutissima]|uniref:Uncharacterized protein n=1 Tax=Podila minutissima TaxID=64525 RepID=A0A9P5VN43_9FUNG|nr:hypothetical protein BG006_003873 [Podila minutissima]